MNIPKKNIQAIIQYLYDNEKKDFEENDEPDNHIFHDIKKVEEWIETT